MRDVDNIGLPVVAEIFGDEAAVTAVGGFFGAEQARAVEQVAGDGVLDLAGAQDFEEALLVAIPDEYDAPAGARWRC